MTSKDFIEAEAGNNGSIILYREGLFWKAYEKSAYAVCTQIKPLKAIKRRLKSLGGGEIVSVGFPCKHEQKYIGSLEHMETMPDRFVLRTLKPIDGQRFRPYPGTLNVIVPEEYLPQINKVKNECKNIIKCARWR